ncbi:MULTISPECIES: hypothetical protein [Campylobacter]|uniref:Abi-like protein n=2 Tax=Campylobacter TaxID=194 RepID=A0A0A8HC13_9BACT|nr:MULTISPECIES: hypothetical protein [Campylobacter]AJC91477.1 hypothetical protein CSUB8521_1668 [Campylobacter subantarcticus LMG 24374]AJD06955.1 hypothetical protein UPTC16712_1466 [Campylobacter lari RM16712]EAL5741000.1 hypothetical protein [Campylobacter lari]EDP6893514.1 hypothetical protein [Campylobacter lari]EGK8008734.1 hypothetical protein [Campylobacter lari]
MQDLEFIFSKQRLEYYKDINEHFENLKLISKIIPKIAILEIYIRNALDYELSFKCKEWIKISDNPFLLAKINEFKDKESLEPHQILSRLSLGVVAKLIVSYKVQNKILELKTFDFRKYSPSNRNFFIYKNTKQGFDNIDKVNIVLNLLHTLRNRACHFENLLKLRENNNKLYPRISTKEKGTNIGLMPDKIEDFLNDLICGINKDLLDYIK